MVPKWQAAQLSAALGFTRLALLLRMHDIPLASFSSATVDLVNRQVGQRHCH